MHSDLSWRCVSLLLSVIGPTELIQGRMPSRGAAAGCAPFFPSLRGRVTAPGTQPSSTYSRHVVARFGDFTNPRTPWSRRLWDVGSFLALEELYDAGLWLDRHVLGASAVRWLQHSLETQLGQDVAFGTQGLRRQLGQALRSDLAIRSDGRRRLRNVIDLGREGYVQRWASHAATTDPPPPERVARSVAAHLLDSGHSLVGLRRWLSGRTGLSAVELLEEASSLDVRGPERFCVWVPALRLPVPNKVADPLAHFSRASDLPSELHLRLQESTPDRLLGAFRYDVEANDAERAVEVVVETLERLRARARFAGRESQFILAKSALVQTEDRFIELRRPERGAAILSLVAEGQLFAVDPAQTFAATRDAIDDALELAGGLNSGALAPAISGSWAALEALLTEAKDTDQEEGKVAAATRAARLTACSWPRAELTAISYQVDARGRQGTDLQVRLDRAGTNRDRATIIADQLRAHRGVPLKRSWRHSSDVAAISRMNALLDSPRDVLTRVSGYLEASLRRMYRCRNVIVHGGSTRGDVLDATLRVVAPTVGATLDRLTHAHLVLGTEPLELATRADLAIAMSEDREVGYPISGLLE